MSALMMRDHQRAYDNLSPDDDGQPESERIAELLGLPHYHWLADCLADAMQSGDWLYVGNQCVKHLSQRNAA